MAKNDEVPADPGTQLIWGGLGVGAIGVAGAVLLGATCPVCVVATPALLGAGLYQKWKRRRSRLDDPEPPER